ncbi:MAG: hypothetical protein GY787_32390 [Alteromonadales bacterium]|nr:hypothetical protein [Alteromonadales bacterium]
MMLTANHKDNKWRGIVIKRGSRLTSLDKLSSETSLSVSKIRTAIKKLISTSEITSKSHSQHTVFTMINYDMYQDDDKQNDKPATNESQTNNKRIATNKNDKNVNNEKNDKKDIVAKAPKRFTPPTDIETVSYFEEKGSTASEAEKFWFFYDSKNWMVGKSKMKRWQSAASGWIKRNKTESKDIMKISNDSDWHLQNQGF